MSESTLIERLRGHSMASWPTLAMEAANWIEKLERENLELRHDLERAMANHNADLNDTEAGKAVMPTAFILPPVPPASGAAQFTVAPNCLHPWEGPGPAPARFQCKCGTIVYRSYEDYCDD